MGTVTGLAGWVLRSLTLVEMGLQPQQSNQASDSPHSAQDLGPMKGPGPTLGQDNNIVPR